MKCTNRSRLRVAIWAACSLIAMPCRAQDAHAGHAVAETPGWTWGWDANAFIGWNYQRREFRDFQEVESQNWLMGMGERRAGEGRILLHGMLSLEPFTIQPLGSPQVFQTGETYQQSPLIDYQHPHDLFMQLSGRYERQVSGVHGFVEAALVGAPAIGPAAFMHRPSAAENPTAPLSHHFMDSTHITPGVLTLGAEHRGATLEGSWFRGLEPDENRKDIDLGALDSWAVRGSWRRGGWDAQVSGAHLKTPEFVEPFANVTRLTASAGFTRADGTLATLLAWGQNREIHGVLDGYLFEGTYRPRPRDAFYTRAEWTTKDILGAGGRHPRGIVHFHPLSKVGALTGGYVRDLRAARDGRYGIGGDITVYRVPRDLQDNYGTSPLSFHLFLRYRPARAAAPHVH